MKLIERERTALMQTYARLSLDIDHGEGVHLTDRSGKKYLDFFGGLAVNALGYGNPRVRHAIEKQLDRYIHISNIFTQEGQVELAERLLKQSGYSHVFFSNSGTEAVEGALKLVRKWGSAECRTDMVSFTSAFHGRSTGALSLMGDSSYSTAYDVDKRGFVSLPYNDVEALQSAIDERTSAVFLEFIQGEAGIVPARDEFIETLISLRSRFGFLIVADEIQTGMGRTGTFLAAERWSAAPDIVLLAKALGGGLPLGAILVREGLQDVFGTGGHGSTFGGNPVACAAGCAVLDEMTDRKLFENADERGKQLIEGLEDIAQQMPHFIKEIRGRGCMIGVELTEDASSIAKDCLDRGLILNVTHKRVLRLLPPLIITQQDVEDALEILRSVLRHRNRQQ